MKLLLLKAALGEVLRQHLLSSKCFKICTPCLSYIISFKGLSSSAVLYRRLLGSSLRKEEPGATKGENLPSVTQGQ